MVVVDSTLWIDFFRGSNEPGRAALRQLIRAHQAVLTGIVLAELLQGCRTPGEVNTVLDHVSALPFLEMSFSVWRRVGELSSGLRRKGTTIPLTDLIIAALAMEHDAEVFTTDPHFQKIPGLTLHRQE